ncbi:MAG: CoA transferase [Dehalococcoidia bacterium]|nr:CoA transferase [Dehalococcoidia bacterium]
MTAESQHLPLEGLLVVELTRVIVGPAIGRTLADFGATVIRVQSAHFPDFGGSGLGTRDPGPGGGSMGRWNFNKKSITLNLRNADGRELLDRLLRKADVFIENNAGGAIDRLGYGYDHVSSVNPRIIMVSTSMFIGFDPWSRYRAYGNQTAALMGFQSLVGYEGDTEVNAMPGPYTDFTSPPLATTAIMAALRHRRKTGRGQYIRQGQGQSVMLLMAGLLLGHQKNGIGTRYAHFSNRDAEMSPHGCFEASDGRWLAIAVRHEDDWEALCGAAGWNDLATDELLRDVDRRREQQDEIEARVEEWVLSQDSETALTLLHAAGVPVGLVVEPDELPGHPQFVALNAWEDATGRKGEHYSVHNLPYRISGVTPRHWSAPTAVGEDTFEILTQLLDVDEDKIASLYASGVLD